jgi:hypothetical protein
MQKHIEHRDIFWCNNKRGSIFSAATVCFPVKITGGIVDLWRLHARLGEHFASIVGAF